MFRLFLSLPILLAGCLKDETISGFVDQTTSYQLTELSGEPFLAKAEISFPEQGTMTGKAPCNSFSARQSAPYPWFELGPVAATLSVCPEMEKEEEFFGVLGRMTLIEALGDTIILRNDAGEEMVFRTSQE